MRRFRDNKVKWSYVTRCVPDTQSATIAAHAAEPEAGALSAARVLRLGAHEHLEDRHGRRMRLYPGDVIIGAYGNRYATDFYEGYVPTGARCHLLTAGGLVGTVASRHDAREEPTELEVIGSVVDDAGTPLSTATFARVAPPPAAPALGTIVVVGSGMNAGKTTTVAGLVRALSRTGITVGAGKVTGSGSGKDRWAYLDAGADVALEFLDFGIPSTFGYDGPRLVETMHSIRSGLTGDGAEVVVLELADGLLQADTSFLLGQLRGIADQVVLAAVDALSAHAGVAALRKLGLPICAVSGVLTRSGLTVREAEQATGVPVTSPWEFDPQRLLTASAAAA